ncbi:MAG: carbon-nitrogen hydrolase family protein [Sedimentisphaerales bacterium]|nr:carbon-nitrogen hydrolase family protein [Sedimentisphaerales bacterium]
MQKHTIAACQISCGPQSKVEDNARKIRQYMQKATANGARLVLFPELSLSGYSVDTDDIAVRLRQTTDSLIEHIRSDSKRLNIATVVGIYEQSPQNKVYNTALAIGPDGSESRYAKIHIPPNEGHFASSQRSPVVADFGFVRLGLSICFDNWFPESARMAYLCGAEILHMPFYWPAQWEVCDDLKYKRTPVNNDLILKARRERMMKVFPARALDNGLYVVMLDQVCQSDDIAKHLPGKSMVFDPYGELIAETKGWEEEVLYFEFLPERVKQQRCSKFFPGRSLRPQVYRQVWTKINSRYSRT